jgi:hypothetical protein
MEKFLYVRSTTAIADDDDNAGSNLFPASSFLGAESTSDTSLSLYFKQRKNQFLAADSATTEGKADVVVLTCTANKQKEVMLAIAEAITGVAKKYSKTGIITIADDYTAEYISEYVTAVGDPTIAAGNS